MGLASFANARRHSMHGASPYHAADVFLRPPIYRRASRLAICAQRCATPMTPGGLMMSAGFCQPAPVFLRAAITRFYTYQPPMPSVMMPLHGRRLFSADDAGRYAGPAACHYHDDFFPMPDSAG